VNRRWIVVGASIVVAAAAVVASRPLWMKWRTRSALEEAASNACACMLGRHGSDLEAELLAVRAGIIAKPNPPDRLWPARCKPWGEAALAAHAEAARWDGPVPLPADASWSSRNALEALRVFWVRDPDPRVPLPETRGFELNQNKLVTIIDDERLDLRIADGALEINGKLRINRDDRIEQIEQNTASFPGHPTWRAIDGEPGSKRFWTDDSRFYDDAGHALGSEWFIGRTFARSFADGRLVAHVEAAAIEATYGEIWEYAPAKKLARSRFEPGAPFTSKSTTIVDEWMLYKHVGEDGAGTVAAIDFSRGAAAKPITLGPVDKTSRVLARTYGTCRARGTFVDMDPSFLIRSKTGWTFAGLQQSINRIVSCDDDVAMVTEWTPLEIRKCTEEGCALVSFPRIDAGREGLFAADEHHVFQVVRDDGAVGVHVYALANPNDAKHVPVLDRAWEVRMRVVAGRALLFVQQDRLATKWAIVSVRPDGAVRVITPM